MDRSKFFAALRARGSGVFGTSLSQGQVAGTESILDEAQKRGTRLTWLAYMLATAYLETAHTMQPIEEYGKGNGRKYGAKAGPYGKVYYGRGFVQLTWLENYQKAAAKLGVDFVQFPERVMEPRLAAAIMFDGMEQGWFAGDKIGRHTLARHIGGDKPDYVSARRIINGTDKAAAIAGYARAFEAALRGAGYVSQAPKPRPAPPAPIPAPKPVPVPPVSKPAPEPVPAPAKPGFWELFFARLAKMFKRGK
ncbi:MAG: hypothetical protein PS018_26430 [bacterium]|nr:hypothetical protein [bacterium]